MENNTEYFNQVAAELFGRLLINFPKPIDIESTDLVPKTINDRNELWEGADLAEHAVRWLKRYGYIDFKSSLNDKFFEVIISEKGLTALNATPSSIDRKKSAAEQIKEAAKKGALGGVEKLVPDIIEHGTTFAFAAIRAAAGI